ncbi:TIGR00282 family metallophosphoesterase [Cohnella hashimotonis]|uniref:TIGR00282 family metallophosphoesterase n=1 Tax=Cohnella hashimotonis TaxID=2826895 RepID=A0ABT6TJL2_9BACL|nr:TIGR00282 family metallophosphoesterase [Cohnella hashimotonis]MDI4646134.1 TIGR00282 family metallophosphoesterase [Cohnella hashimotonis]
MKVVFIGDIVGQVGRDTVKRLLPWLKDKYQPHIVIANGENAAGGRGINAAITRELFSAGVQGITMGNHTWDNREIFEFIDDEARMVRPANLPPGTPGRGYTIIKSGSRELAIVNLIGRTFLPPSDCPFRKADEIVDELRRKTKCILVDFHAEATSEKIAMGWHLDGRASVVLGTHTHVQTNDDRILPEGTAYVTDAGMTGPRDGVLGMERESVLRKFITGMPTRFQVAETKWHLNGLFVDIDEATGKALSVRTIRVDEDSWIPA